MRSRKERFVRRRPFKRRSNRKLSNRDLAVLDFLWTWKVASTPMLGEVAFKGQSIWWVYKALRQLKREGYIQALPRGKSLDMELWALTVSGFEVFLMDRDDIAQYRYRAHAPLHDYLGTCLQIGPQGFGQSEGRIYFTEQMLASLTSANFPRSFRRVEGHIPDGMTQYRNGVRDALVAYEVDINLKDEERYKKTLAYYSDGPSPGLIIWLVKNEWMKERICQAMRSEDYTDRSRELLAKTAFVLQSDFIEKVWEAPAIGAFAGASLRKLHENLWQSLGKKAEKSLQNSRQAVFFPKFKSPQKLKPSVISHVTEDLKHPSGAGGTQKCHADLNSSQVDSLSTTTMEVVTHE